MSAGRRLLFAGLIAVTVAIYLVMVLWTLPMISREAGGMAPFDLRPGGYTAEEAEGFVSALSAQGRAIYLGPQHALDTLFPPLMAATMAWAVTLLWRGRWRVTLIALAVVAATADLGENVAVTRLLYGAEAGTAVVASGLTVLKSAASSVVYAFILAGLLRPLWRRVRG